MKVPAAALGVALMKDPAAPASLCHITDALPEKALSGVVQPDALLVSIVQSVEGTVASVPLKEPAGQLEQIVAELTEYWPAEQVAQLALPALLYLTARHTIP